MTARALGPRRSLAPLLAVVALLSAACPSNDPGGAQPLSITLKFDAAGVCLSNCDSIDNCALDCGGVVGLFLVDAASDAVLDQKCIALKGMTGETLRSLPGYLDQVELTHGVSIGRHVVVELAVFSPSPFVPDPTTDAATGPTCKRVFKAAGAKPATDDGKQPAYWGRSPPLTIHAGDNPLALSIGCVADSRACAERPDALITAEVTDMQTQLYPANAQELDVRFGKLLSDASGAMSFAQITELLLPDTPPNPPAWSKLVPSAVYDSSCLATRVTRLGADTGYSVVSCDGSELVGGADTNSIVTTTGYTFAKAFVDKLLPLLGLTKIPDHGMLIGRVVDASGQAVADAVVAPLLGTADIVYLDVNDTPSGSLTSTSASGWFVVVTPPRLSPSGDPKNCCQIFSATRTPDVGCTQGEVGLVDEKIMAARIVVDPSIPNGCGSPP